MSLRRQGDKESAKLVPDIATARKAVVLMAENNRDIPIQSKSNRNGHKRLEVILTGFQFSVYRVKEEPTPKALRVVFEDRPADMAFEDANWEPGVNCHCAAKHQWDPIPAIPRPDPIQRQLPHIWNRHTDADPYLKKKDLMRTKAIVTFQWSVRFLLDYINIMRSICAAIWSSLLGYRGFKGKDPSLEINQSTINELGFPTPLRALGEPERESPSSLLPSRCRWGERQEWHSLLLCIDSPLKIHTQLQPPRYGKVHGWGLMFKEGVVTPEWVKAIISILLCLTFVALVGNLVYVIVRFSFDQGGYSIFGTLGASISFATLMLALLKAVA